MLFLLTRFLGGDNCCEHKNWLILNIDAISILFQDEDLTPEQIAGEFNSMRLNR